MFLSDLRNGFAFYDPPYIEKGQKLYLNDYTIEDHHALAAQVGQLDCPWVVTYDRVAAIRERLYPQHRRMFYGLSYSTQRRHKGDEVMFLSDRLELPNTWQSGQPIKLSGKRPHLVYGRIESMKPHTEMNEGRGGSLWPPQPVREVPLRLARGPPRSRTETAKHTRRRLLALDFAPQRHRPK